jgi:7-carboxy-7-deazaguanine synthase
MISLAEPLHLVTQGEGINIGKPMILLRVAGCNINCPECDSKHTWNTINKKYTQAELIRDLNKIKDDNNDLHHIMITGGNPELYEREITSLISYLSDHYYWKFDFEVPGLITWPNLNNYYDRIQFNISPKIGSLHSKDLNYRIFEHLPYNYIIKIVVKQDTFDQDILTVKEFIKKYSISRSKVYLMPQGTTREEIIKESQFLIPKCCELGFCFSPRVHVLIFDNKKLV